MPAEVYAAIDADVRLVGKHYVGYGPNPVVDEHYAQVGQTFSRRRVGYDCFPGNALFGGQPYDTYRRAVAALMGRAYKHESYGTQLGKVLPSLDIRNLLSPVFDPDDLAASVAAEVECPAEVARTALELVTVTTENKDLVADSGPAPALLAVGQRRLLLSYAAATTEPFLFMLRMLQRRFRDDWYNAVLLREAVFRNELLEVLATMGVEHVAGERVIRRRDASRETDIDAVAYDVRSGVLALFQLKWQDPFTYSMTERASRLRNFVDKSNKWVEAVASWTATLTPAAAAAALGVPHERAAKLSTVLMFVVSRYHAHFSGPNELDSRAAFANWARVCRTLAPQDLDDPLRSLWRSLQDKTAAGPARTRSKREEYEVEGLRITVG